MAIGRMPGARQEELFIAASAVRALDNPFYAERMGRPGLLPGVYFRRVHVRGQKEIRKRLLVHAAAFNLGLMMRARFGFGTPRGLQGLAAAATALADASARHFATVVGQIGRIFGLLSPNTGSFRPSGRLLHNKTALTRLPPFVQSARWQTTSSTAC